MDVRQLKDAATEHFRKGRFAKAAEAYAQLVRAEPQEGQHLIKLGDSHRRDGKKPQALEAYRRAVDDYVRKGIVIKAIAACKLILELDPNQKDAQEALASLIQRRYSQGGRPSEAPPPEFPAVRGDFVLPIELPEDDGAVEIESGGEVLTLAQPKPEPSRLPPRARESAPPPLEPPRHTPPVLVPEAQVSGEESTTPEGPPSFAYRARPVEDAGPIELDFEGSGTPPGFPAPATRTRAVHDLGDELVLFEVTNTPQPEEVEELELLEVEPLDEIDGLLVAAENTGEQEVLRLAASVAAMPTTAVGEILSDSLVLEAGEDDENEIEVGSVTLSAGRVETDEEERRAERAEQRRLANAVSFELEQGLVEEEEIEAEPEPTPAPASADLDQQRVPLFEDLPREAFLDLLERLEFRRFEAGEVILREGETGRSIFVLSTGAATVVKAHGTEDAVVLAALGDGAFFGEMALLNGAPRLASVVAEQDCEVLELREDLLRDLTGRHPSVARSLRKFYRQRLLQNVMAISPLFRAFDRRDRRQLVERFKLRETKAGEVIIREGERPDGLYVVMHGAALVTKKDPAQVREMPLALLREGDVFGEMSLLSRQPATATVTARRRTLVLRLPKEVFDVLMFTHPAVLEVVSELSDQRAKVNEGVLSGRIEVPRLALV